MSSYSTPLQWRAHELSLGYLDEASARYGIALTRPCIRFDLKGTAAGQVRLQQRQLAIRYNAVLLEEHREAFLSRTVPHEVAHLVAYQMYGRRIRPHGREWQGIMVDFGAQPSRCHGFDTARSRVRHLRRFAYQCACQTHQLTSIRHNRVQRGVTYLCHKCKRPLTQAV